jgi:hypothetical protein
MDRTPAPGIRRRPRATAPPRCFATRSRSASRAAADLWPAGAACPYLIYFTYRCYGAKMLTITGDHQIDALCHSPGELHELAR